MPDPFKHDHVTGPAYNNQQRPGNAASSAKRGSGNVDLSKKPEAKEGSANVPPPYVAPAWKKPMEYASTIRVVTSESNHFLNIFTVSGNSRLEQLAPNNFTVWPCAKKVRIGLELDNYFLIFVLYQNEDVVVRITPNQPIVQLANPSDARAKINSFLANGIVRYTIPSDKLEILWKR